MSCTGGGYLTSNMLVAFPFEDGQCLSWADWDHASDLQMSLQKCFVDAGIYMSSRPDGGAWPSIGDFYASGSTISFKIAVGECEVNVSVSGSSGTRFPIVNGSAPWGSYVVVMSSEGIMEYCGISPPSRTFSRSSSSGREGLYLRLCAKCATFPHHGLSSVKVFDGWHSFDSGPHFSLSGDVLVKPGNNMILEEEDNDPHAVRLHADPGAGLGKIPCSDDDCGKGAIAIAGPDGHTRVFNDTCYDLEPSTTTGIVKMHVKCTACCTCKMYESIVNERLANLANVIRTAESSIRTMHGEYEECVKMFNKWINEPKIDDVTMTLSGMPTGANIGPKIKNEKVTGKMNMCVFTATITNSSFFEVNVNVKAISGTGRIVEASAAWSGQEGTPLSKTGDSSDRVTGMYSIYPGRQLVLTFISVKDDMVSEATTGGYSGSVSADISWKGSFLGTLEKSVSV